MSNDPTREHLLAILQPYGQEHLLRFWDSLTPAQQEHLAGQVGAIDWANVDHWIRQALSGACETVDFAKLTPAPYVSIHPADAAGGPGRTGDAAASADATGTPERASANRAGFRPL